MALPDVPLRAAGPTGNGAISAGLLRLPHGYNRQFGRRVPALSDAPLRNLGERNDMLIEARVGTDYERGLAANSPCSARWATAEAHVCGAVAGVCGRFVSRAGTRSSLRSRPMPGAQDSASGGGSYTVEFGVMIAEFGVDTLSSGIRAAPGHGEQAWSRHGACGLSSG